jgi:hypothetical protein
LTGVRLFRLPQKTRRSLSRPGRHLGNRAQFRLDRQSQYDIAMIERERGAEIWSRVRPAYAT